MSTSHLRSAIPGRRLSAGYCRSRTANENFSITRTYRPHKITSPTKTITTRLHSQRARPDIPWCLRHRPFLLVFPSLAPCPLVAGGKHPIATSSSPPLPQAIANRCQTVASVFLASWQRPCVVGLSVASSFAELSPWRLKRDWHHQDHHNLPTAEAIPSNQNNPPSPPPSTPTGMVTFRNFVLPAAVASSAA